MGDFVTLVTRHEDKMKPVLPSGVKMRPGDEYDRRLPLSYKGQQNAFKTGEAGLAIPHNFDRGIVDRSTLVRTTMTGQHMLAGAGYNPDDDNIIIWNPENADIGLANGMAFDHPELPPYAPKLPEADNYVIGILRDFWSPKESAEASRPAVAKVARAFMANKIAAIEELMPLARQGAKVFHAQFTHAPVIDSLDAALFGTVQYDESSGSMQLDREKFPGHYAMGTFISGRWSGGTADNPTFEITGKKSAGGFDRVKTYSLDDMKRLTDRLYTESERRL
ncbi:MAG: hypothetical protein ABIH82_04100 [Candidatus Woesearchaeota archaeon]